MRHSLEERLVGAAAWVTPALGGSWFHRFVHKLCTRCAGTAPRGPPTWPGRSRCRRSCRSGAWWAGRRPIAAGRAEGCPRPGRRCCEQPEPNNLRSAGARRHPQGGGRGPVVGLTPCFPTAYRWPVAPCRRVPHVHDPPPGRQRGWAVPAESPSGPQHPRGVDIPRDLRRNSREQAYVPAEQPSPSQGARLPPAHADPRRPRHPVEPSPQGPQEPGCLTARARGSAPCSPPPTA